ncbi:MAG TPA: transposase, partial [Anaeromyxobacteraceae bacterium]
HRRYVLTPGQNRKRFVAGALNATTRRMTWVDAPTKASELFHKLVWKLLGEYRAARRIHLILDNYIIHSSKKTQRFLAQFGDRLVLHFLPPYCPDDNRIERVWLDLHANVTRNHRCRNTPGLPGSEASGRSAALTAPRARRPTRPSRRRGRGPRRGGCAASSWPAWRATRR